MEPLGKMFCQSAGQAFEPQLGTSSDPRMAPRGSIDTTIGFRVSGLGFRVPRPEGPYTLLSMELGPKRPFPL